MPFEIAPTLGAALPVIIAAASAWYSRERARPEFEKRACARLWSRQRDYSRIDRNTFGHSEHRYVPHSDSAADCGNAIVNGGLGRATDFGYAPSLLRLLLFLRFSFGMGQD